MADIDPMDAAALMFAPTGFPEDDLRVVPLAEAKRIRNKAVEDVVADLISVMSSTKTTTVQTAGPVAEASATGPEEEDGGGGATAGRGNPACAAPASLSQPDGAVTGGTPEIHSFIGRADAALLRRVADWFDTNPRRVLIGLWSTGFGGPLDVVLQVITELDEEVGP